MLYILQGVPKLFFLVLDLTPGVGAVEVYGASMCGENAVDKVKCVALPWGAHQTLTFDPPSTHSVHHVDSMGLHFLEDLIFSTRAKGIELILANPNDKVRIEDGSLPMSQQPHSLNLLPAYSLCCLFITLLPTTHSAGISNVAGRSGMVPDQAWRAAWPRERVCARPRCNDARPGETNTDTAPCMSGP